MKKSAIILIFISVFISCKKPIANFTEPQPANTKDIAFFPKKLIGTYHNYEINVDLIIQNQLVLLQNHFTDTLNQETILELQNESNLITAPINDTLYSVKYAVTDTLFNLANKDVLRKMKGHYFLNSQNGQNNWEVKKLTYKNDMASLSEIYDEESLQKLDEITETASDTLHPRTYSLTKKQFREFVVKNGFSEGTVFLRTK